MGSGSRDACRVRGTAEEKHTVWGSINRKPVAELRYGGLDGWENEWSCEYGGTTCGGTEEWGIEEWRRKKEERVKTRSTAVYYGSTLDLSQWESGYHGIYQGYNRQ